MDVFTDYCKPGLCEHMGGTHSGCVNGVLHNGKFQSPHCSKDAAFIPLKDSDKQDILDFHNEQRNFVACGGLYKEYGIGPGCRHGVMTWDAELEKTAFLHTSYCIVDHDKCRSTIKYPFSGQNIGTLSYSKNPSDTTIYINIFTYLWYEEHLYAKMNMINNFDQQTQAMVGHFLTSINERNNRVGCSFGKFFDEKHKKHTVMLSCNYPTSNIAESAIYNSCKKPASHCTTGTDPRYKFLCSSKEKYDVSGQLKHTPYDGHGAEEFKRCGRRPELFHYESKGGDLAQSEHNIMFPDKPLHEEKPALDAPDGNPSAGGVPDYSDDDYDDPNSSAFALSQNFLVMARTPSRFGIIFFSCSQQKFIYYFGLFLAKLATHYFV